ncbi:MAG: hypothetical protein H0T47_08685 [Planctomycetaceae bacterium]|nr:hypothetical protein [Planctomycetaceae bacterium]
MFRVHSAFIELLTQHGLADCDSLFDTQNGTALRRLKNRENWRLDLADHGQPRTLYLKKHHVRTLGTRLRARLNFAAPSTPARMEAEQTERLARLGVPTMTVAAYGERLRADGTLIAAFLTDELSGFEQLDLFLPRRFKRSNEPDLRTLVARVAAVAARLHRLGFNHRDFYTCHFFIHETHPGEFAVNLIDLQRVQRWPALLRRRWIVKDLAQLAYSSHPRLIGSSARLRFFLAYLGRTRLDQRAKRFARSVLRRAASLEKKHGPYRDWSSSPQCCH